MRLGHSRGGTLAVLLALGGLSLAGCGGGGGGTPPTGGGGVPTYSVSATVFYDENANGQLDPTEATRVPGVEVVVGSGSGRSAAGSGQAQVSGITEGLHPVAVRIDSVPAYYQPLPAGTVQVPGGASEVRVPLALPIGGNNANLYLAMGDSITGDQDEDRYGGKLQALLGPHFGRAEVRSWGRPGTTTWEGATRTRVTLGWFRPAYLLVLYGTNDWQDQTCQNQGPAACRTIDALRTIVDDARDRDTLPVLATIIPVNPTLAPAGRNQWIDQMNVLIKALGQELQVPVADLNAEMKSVSPALAPLFEDDVHPNQAGNQALAQGWFKAITRGRAGSAPAARGFGFVGLR